MKTFFQKAAGEKIYGIVAIAAFGLNLIWEIAQMFAYETKHGETLAGSLIFCALAALVDALVTISIYALLTQILKRANRLEFYLAAAFLGAWCAVFFEWLARFFNLWSYNRKMLEIPLIDTGLLPFMQLTVLIPLAIWLTGKLAALLARDAGNLNMEVEFMDKQKDPICGMQIEIADAAGQSDYEGRTYYFCSPACKEQFDADPTRFTNESENK